MTNTAAELHSLTRAAPVAAVSGAPRVDLYSGIHKAARALMADTLLAVGRMDPDDGPELAHTSVRVMQLLDFCRDHLRHENEFVHAALESRAPGVTGTIAREHAAHAHDIEALAAATTRLLECPDAERAPRALALYRSLSVFMAHNFEHMHVEETLHNAVLWARFTDDELRSIEAGVKASILPRKMSFILRWLVPFMNPVERAELMRGMRERTTVLAFYTALDLVRPHLTSREWCKLSTALELRAAA